MYTIQQYNNNNNNDNTNTLINNIHINKHITLYRIITSHVILDYNIPYSADPAGAGARHLH